MRNCDIKFVNKEITPFAGLSLFFKMLEKCHFEEHVMQSGVPLQGSNRGYKPIQLILGLFAGVWCGANCFGHLDAYVVGKRYIQRRGGYRSWGLSKYYVNLKFIDNQETFRLDDSKVFKKINQGDSVCVNFVKGLYGINIIKDISPKNK